MDNWTIITNLGSLFELTGGILLASEMIGLSDKMRKWNSSLQNKIQSRKSELPTELATMALTAGLLFIIVDVTKKFPLRALLAFLFPIIFLYILIIINFINGELLHFLEYSIEKLGTKKVLGYLGLIFLFLGIVWDDLINFTTN